MKTHLLSFFSALLVFNSSLTSLGLASNFPPENSNKNIYTFDYLNKTEFCPALPEPTQHIIRVKPSQTKQLRRIAAKAKSGDTILLEDGYYNLDGNYLWFSNPGVTLRSASGNPDKVILDGAYKSRSIITIAASDITVAEITLTRSFHHPIHVVSSRSGNTVKTFIYRVKLIDPREQAIKINPHKKGYKVDSGTIACSYFELTDTGRPQINPNPGGCYTGGIDAHEARGWVVRDNIFKGFWCNTGLSEFAIHFWKGSRETIVKRNYIKDSARGIGFGLLKKSKGKTRSYIDNLCPSSGDSYVGHYGGIIINNFIHASSTPLLNSPDGFDCGICLWSACKVKVNHNSIVSTGRNFSSIEWRFPGTTDVEIINNIATHSLRKRNRASAIQKNNLKPDNLSLFIDSNTGDLHLSPSATMAINRGKQLHMSLNQSDIDGDKRDSSPDIGADELNKQR